MCHRIIYEKVCKPSSHILMKYGTSQTIFLVHVQRPPARLRMREYHMDTMLPRKHFPLSPHTSIKYGQMLTSRMRAYRCSVTIDAWQRMLVNRPTLRGIVPRVTLASRIKRPTGCFGYIFAKSWFSCFTWPALYYSYCQD